MDKLFDCCMAGFNTEERPTATTLEELPPYWRKRFDQALEVAKELRGHSLRIVSVWVSDASPDSLWKDDPRGYAFNVCATAELIE